MKPFASRTIALALACLLGTGVALWRARQPSPLLPDIPAEAIRTHAGKSIYFNLPALDLFQQAHLEPPGSGAQSALYQPATQSPELFRQLDRKERFDTVLLAGDPAGFKPLLDHLLETGDWKLVHADHALLLFKRNPSTPWQVDKLVPLNARLKDISRQKRVRVLCAIANQMLALKQLQAARTETDLALEADPKAPLAWTALARYHAASERWNEALEAATHALEFDRSFVPALATTAQIFVAIGQFHDAYPLTARLVDRLPKDPQILFLHATAAHGVKLYAKEIETLNSLIALAQDHGYPTSGYRIYLGQAYAADGQAAFALREFKAALDAGDLSQEQVTFVTDASQRIRKRTGL